MRNRNHLPHILHYICIQEGQGTGPSQSHYLSISSPKEKHAIFGFCTTEKHDIRYFHWIQVATLSMILLLNVVGIGLVMVVTVFFLNGTKRVSAVGWICAVFNIAVFAAPLSIMVIC